MTAGTIDLRDLPGTREHVIARDGGLFPVVVARGDRLVAVVRGGAGHLGRAGRLELLTSDIGSAWSAPTRIAEGERDCRNPALGCTESGALVLAYQRQGSYDERGAYRPELRDPGGARPIDVVVSRSDDGGLTWSAPAPLGVRGLAASSPYGKIAVLPGGELLLAIYDPFAGDGGASHVVRSVDDGRTWSGRSLVARGCNETALAVTGEDELVAVLRTADRDQRLVAARSSDRGRTWSSPEPVTGPRQHPGDLILLAGGELVLTYGNRAGPYRIEGRVSRDGGRRWSEPVAFSGDLYADTGPGRVTDLGYPSSAVAAGRAVTIYYVNPDLAPRPDGRPPHLEPPYPATGYRAVAVSWREDELVTALAGPRSSH